MFERRRSALMLAMAIAIALCSSAVAPAARAPTDDPGLAPTAPVKPGKAAREAKAAAATIGGALADAKFEPGKETRIDDKAVGGPGYFIVYLPKEYTPDRAWPAIFCYHGLGQKPTTYPFQQVLGGKGFIIVGMPYYSTGMDAFGTVQNDIETVQRLAPELAKVLKIDPRQLFVGGFSQGGWMTSTIAEATAPMWAGVVITGAGRHGSGTLKNAATFRGKPMYIGAGEKDSNADSARQAADFYRGEGADVALEIWPGVAHSIDTKSKKFADWLWGSGPLKQVKADLADARAAQAAGKLGVAYAKFKQAADVPGGHEQCVEAGKTADAIAKEAEGQLASAEGGAAAKRYTEAIAALSRLSAAYAGSPFGERATKSLAALQADPAVQASLGQDRINAQAKLLHEQAQTAELAKDYARAIRFYEQLIATCEKSDLAPAAKDRLAALKSDKAVMAAVRAKDAERDCRGWLSLADNYAKNGLKDKAREFLQKVIDKYGDTDWGAQAKERLKQLK